MRGIFTVAFQLLVLRCAWCMPVESYTTYACPSTIQSNNVHLVFEKICYEFVTNKKDYWTGARHDCNNRGGDLAIVSNSKIQYFLQTTLQNMRVPHGIWIGLNDRHKEGHFEWVDGSSLGYSHWAVHEGNGLLHLTQDCVQIQMDDHGLWHDRECHLWPNKFSYICQFPTIATIHTVKPEPTTTIQTTTKSTTLSPITLTTTLSPTTPTTTLSPTTPTTTLSPTTPTTTLLPTTPTTTFLPTTSTALPTERITTELPNRETPPPTELPNRETPPPTELQNRETPPPTLPNRETPPPTLPNRETPPPTELQNRETPPPTLPNRETPPPNMETPAPTLPNREYPSTATIMPNKETPPTTALPNRETPSATLASGEEISTKTSQPESGHFLTPAADNQNGPCPELFCNLDCSATGYELSENDCRICKCMPSI